jgi:hypothetical protein
MPFSASLVRGGDFQNQSITERWANQLHRKRQSGSRKPGHDGRRGMAGDIERCPCLELMSGGELAWVLYPAGEYESTSGQQNIDIPESIVNRRDHFASTLLRKDIVAGR